MFSKEKYFKNIFALLSKKGFKNVCVPFYPAHYKFRLTFHMINLSVNVLGEKHKPELRHNRYHVRQLHLSWMMHTSLAHSTLASTQATGQRQH